MKATAPQKQYVPHTRGWLTSFCLRKHVVTRKAERTEVGRIMVEAKSVQHLFEMLRDVRKTFKINSAGQVVVCDESGFQTSMMKIFGLVATTASSSSSSSPSSSTTGAAGGRGGERTAEAWRRAAEDAPEVDMGTRQTTTLLAALDALGRNICNLFITMGKVADRPPLTVSEITRKDPDVLRHEGRVTQDLLHASPTAFITKGLWGKFVRQLIHNLDTIYQRPADQWTVLVTDGHSAHFDMDTIVHAFTNRLLIITIPPHSSAELQVEDVSVFGPLKKEFKKLVSAYSASIPEFWANKDWTPRAIAYALRNVLAAMPGKEAGAIVKSGMRHCGLWDYDKDVFLNKRSISERVAEFKGREVARATAVGALAGAKRRLPWQEAEQMAGKEIE